MTENTTAIPTDETTFGTDVRPAMEAYNQAVEAARKNRDTAWVQVEKPLHAACTAVSELLPYPQANSISDLIRTLSEKKRNDDTEAIHKAYRLAVDRAKEARDAAMEDADEFTRFVVGHVGDNYGASYVETLLERVPFTFASLKALAETEGWCDDFEDLAREAVRRGALPDDMVEIRREVATYDVPYEYGAQEGEKWVRIADVPAYVRTEEEEGRPYSFYRLRRYLKNDRYEKVEETSEGASS